MDLIAHLRPGSRTTGVVRSAGRAWPRAWPCVMGEGSVAALKREGDGTTPVGRWPLRRVLYRADRLVRPNTTLPVRPISPRDGWCAAPGDRNYNRPVRLPYDTSAESLWRADRLYDLVVVLGYNDIPRARARGSAIFMHVKAATGAPTAGCVALAQGDLLALIAQCRPGDVLVVQP